MQTFEIVALKTGVNSLRSIELGETFHPVTGPWVEANVLHVQQQQLVERSRHLSGSVNNVRKFVIWDVGFGAAANVLAAVEALRDSETEIEIHSFDKTQAPVEFALSHADELVYPGPYKELLGQLLRDRQAQITSRMSWQFHLGDFREQIKRPGLPAPHAILYDPYSPVSNPEMWSLDHFKMLRECLHPEVPCLLTNYTRSTAVRVTLLLAGFFVGVGCEVGEKAETTLASNQLELLRRPLDNKWVKRISQSTNSAPMRGLTYSKAPMTLEEYDLLQRSAQFQL